MKGRNLSFLKRSGINTIILFLLTARLVFIFSTAQNSTNSEKLTTNNTGSITSISQPVNSLTRQPVNPSTDDPISETELINTKVTTNINMTEDIKILELMHTKNPNDLNLSKTLIEKLAQNYDFVQANKYLKELFANPNYKQGFDPILHLYILLHDPSIVSITDLQSIQNLMPIMDNYRNKGLISTDDYNFYKGLLKIRYKDYMGAKALFDQTTSPRYQTVTQSILQAIAQYDPTQNIPSYYQDGLVALSLLKNGYFSIAKKLALGAALTNNKYILPYQILAYTHFLTNNRETASEYFLKLADFDKTNKELYKFLIGISYFRSQDYEQAILYLTQIDNPNLQTDTYRYLILSYIQQEDKTQAVSIRQKLLGQTDITAADYYTYFYNTFYYPYLNNLPAQIYQENNTLAQLYLNSCDANITLISKDICTYGRIGLDLINGNLSSAISGNLLQSPEIFGNLLNLANKYNTPYLFIILGNLYEGNKDLIQAKQSYAKALSISLDDQEIKYIQDKLAQLNN